jgi:hypothetical protein
MTRRAKVQPSGSAPARDHHADGYEIVERPVHQGYEWSEQITGAIDSGSTNSETLMRLRSQLGNLIDADLGGLNDCTQAWAENPHADIEAVME